MASTTIPRGCCAWSGIGVRLGFTVEERTQMQVANAREAEVEKHIPARALGEELKRISAEDSPRRSSRAWKRPACWRCSRRRWSTKLNLPGWPKYEKAIRVLPGRRALARRPLRNVPVLPDRKADAQGEAGADQGDRDAQGAISTSGRSSKPAPRNWRRRCARRASASRRTSTRSWPPPRRRTCCSCSTIRR